ncbi:MAG: peptidase domain-containing ABC transporter [Alphaproteobacteria bacterium]
MSTVLRHSPEATTPNLSELLTTFYQMNLGQQSQVHMDYSACLPNLLMALGWRGDARQLYDALPHHESEFTEVDLYNVMAVLGYRYDVTNVRNRPLDSIPVPCLYTDSSDELYVLYTHDDNAVHAFHSITQRSQLLTDAMVSGRVLTFEKIAHEDDEAERHARNKAGMKWFQAIVRKFDRLFWAVGGLSILINMMSLAVPLFVMMTYDKVIGANSLITLPFLLAGILGVIVLEGSLRMLRTRMLAWFGARINIMVSTLIFERLMYLSPAQTERAPIASQLARIKAFESVRDFFTGNMFITLLELPFTMVLILAIGLISGPLIWIVLSVTTAYILLIAAMRWNMKLNIHRAARAGSERMQITMETFNKLDSLKYNGVIEPWLERFERHCAKAVLNNFRSTFLAMLVEHIAHALTLCAGVATLAYGVDAIWAGEMSAGGLVAIMILTWRVLSPLQATCSMLPRLEHIQSSIGQVNQLMELEPEREPVKPDLVYKSFKGDVAMQNVGLRYGRFNDPVFTGLTLQAKPGQIVAITGGNGAGKSSILKLVCGLYTPQAGTIRIDGTDSRQLDPIVLRRQMSYLPQTPDFFSGSIAENLRLHRPDASDEELKAALLQSGAWDDVRLLPSGIHTRIGSNNNRMTSSLAYRLGLARLYLNPASIILCDELPFAILNGPAGDAFKQQLAEWRGRSTVFFVTHRNDYLQIADHVILLQLDRKPITGKPSEVLNQARKNR